MLASIMYHHAGSGPFSNSPELLERQFAGIARRGIRTVHPCDELADGPNLCLVFDDAYYDFYHHVYPRLKAHGVKAVLAVPTAFIVEKTDLSPESRLSFPHDQAMEDPDAARRRAPFCTWEEIRQMLREGQGAIAVAAHGHAHELFAGDEPIAEDALRSQSIIERETGAACRSFVPAFGKLPDRRDRLIPSFDHLFTIGGEKYEEWPDPPDEISRYPGDNQADPQSMIESLFPRRSLRYRLGAVRRRVESFLNPNEE